MSPDEIKQALLEQGQTPTADLTADIKLFQTAHPPLTVDGIVGPKTEFALKHGSAGGFIATGWRYRENDIPQLVRLAAHAAYGEIGNVEKPDGSNFVANNKYGNVVDGAPQPWCAAFVSWAYRQCGSSMPFCLSANKIYEWGQKTGRVVTTKLAQPGDIWGVLHSDLHGHVEMVIGVDGPETLFTIGGNVGNAVRGVIRKRSEATFFVRP